MNQEMNAPVASSQAQPGLIARMLNVFTNPQRTFQALKVKPDWIIPALIVVVVMGLFGYVQTTHQGLVETANEMARQKLEARNMTSEQIDQAMAMSEKFRKFSPLTTAVIPLVLLVFLGSGVWLFVSNTLMGAKASYPQMLAVTSYTLLISALGTLIKLPVMMANNNLFVHFSLATFMPDSARETFIYKFLMSATDLFSIWAMAVLSIGIAVICQLKVNKVWPIVVLVNLIVFAISALMM